MSRIQLVEKVFMYACVYVPGSSGWKASVLWGRPINGQDRFQCNLVNVMMEESLER